MKYQNKYKIKHVFYFVYEFTYNRIFVYLDSVFYSQCFQASVEINDETKGYFQNVEATPDFELKTLTN